MLGWRIFTKHEDCSSPEVLGDSYWMWGQCDRRCGQHQSGWNFLSIRSLQNTRAWLRRESLSGSFLSISGRPLTGKFTKNAKSIPLGVFSFTPVFRAVYDMRRYACDVSVRQPSRSMSRRTASSEPDSGQKGRHPKMVAFRVTRWFSRF